VELFSAVTVSLYFVVFS